ncbi:MAG: acyl-ACP--UDP-N-acetylglucosamine O-acyltransferase [Saprospiraceae bacterium]|jgi:UDP-N-acetylglucosamine acyltransferase|nr:acyl-ACP--UDP-N-acetylglucosamine O-acyltransferase [Saprospiraceae bacterium]
MDVHKLSIVDPKAKIGKNVTISPFAIISGDVVIGDDCWIGPFASILDGTRMGNNCKIFQGAIVGSIPQDLKFEGEDTILEIGDNTIIREYCTLNRGTKAGYRTAIGKNCLLMAYVHVAHDCIIHDNVILANNVTLAGHIEIGDFAVLGGLTAVHQFVKIGEHSMIGGGSLVGKDVPPFVKASRDPLSYAGVNTVGLGRRGFTSEQQQLIADIYRVIFVKGSNISQSVQNVAEQFPESPIKNKILEFINNSERGLMKGLRTGSK